MRLRKGAVWASRGPGWIQRPGALGLFCLVLFFLLRNFLVPQWGGESPHHYWRHENWEKNKKLRCGALSLSLHPSEGSGLYLYSCGKSLVYDNGLLAVGVQPHCPRGAGCRRYVVLLYFSTTFVSSEWTMGTYGRIIGNKPWPLAEGEITQAGGIHVLNMRFFFFFDI